MKPKVRVWGLALFVLSMYVRLPLEQQLADLRVSVVRAPVQRCRRTDYRTRIRLKLMVHKRWGSTECLRHPRKLQTQAAGGKPRDDRSLQRNVKRFVFLG
jgi:hypothetical protein